MSNPDCPHLSIIGFGAFGQLIARHLRDHMTLCVCDPVPLVNDLLQVDLAQAARCRIIVLSVPLSQMRSVLHIIAPHLRPGAMVIDVASVKLLPATMMQAILPDHAQIVATHPLFGPASAREGLTGHRIAWCPLRGDGHRRAAAFLRRLGLRVLATTPEAHDREMAVVQGLTHLIAQGLSGIGPIPDRLTTESFRRLVEAVAMVQADSPELLRTILHDNPHAGPVRARFVKAIAGIAEMAETG